MFGVRFVKFQPRDYVIVYKNGKVIKEGTGLSFFYYAPRVSMIKVPLISTETPFIFQELTSDFQTITIQGHVTYRIVDQKKVSEVLNFTLNSKGDKYVSDDPQKLSQKVINIIRVVMKKAIENIKLKEAVTTSDVIANRVLSDIRANNEIDLLGIEILGMSILSILPNKETARALEASAREEILEKADEAIYERRNASINQERIVKENEFNTEIAVENKKQQVLEKKLESERFAQEKQNKIIEEKMIFDTELEEKRAKLIDLSVENSKAEADSKAYALSAVMKSLEDIEPSVLETLSKMEMKPEKLIAIAFQDLADNAQKIGQLNITPDLLQEVIKGVS
ncbi:SPFH domain-containing protein [Clostridium sediminicola]|uniref:SPFH domain-containing protein n=1 Tax=Clostridium sediminicola TaxID=3114879 RepID=UPI0031F272C4